jgi:hypothetical protein
MGSFYTSHTLRGPPQAEVLARLKGRSSYVSTSERSFTTVLDEACESQDIEELAALGANLSEHFKCPVLAVLNHDDSILYFELYESGKKSDEYNSNPAYFGEEAEDNGPSGGNAALLAAAFGASDTNAIEAILRGSEYVFATERHQDLAAALGIPEFAVGIGYTYAEAGDPPPWVPEGTYVPA